MGASETPRAAAREPDREDDARGDAEQTTATAEMQNSARSATAAGTPPPVQPRDMTAKPPRVDTISASAPTIASSTSNSSSASLTESAPPSTERGMGAAPASVPPVPMGLLPMHLRDHLVPSSSGISLSPPISSATTTMLPGGHAPIDGELLPPLSNPMRPQRRALVAEPSRRTVTKRVIVCGAGIIGLTTCYYLAQHGHEVLCVEKESSVGTQSSLCNSALLDPAVFAAWSDATLDKHGKPIKAPSAARTGKSSIEASRIAASRVTEDTWSPTLHMRTPPVNLRRGASDDSSDDDSMNQSPVEQSATASISASRTRPAVRGPGWAGTGKSTHVEFSAVCDPKFWKWRIKQHRNAKKHKVDAHARTLRELGFYSMCKLRELQDQYKKGEVEMDETAEGTIEVFRNDHEFDTVWESDRRHHLEELGMDLQPLDPEEAERVEPALRPEVFEPGAILSAYGTSGDVHKMCQNLYRLCVRKGVMFRFNTEVWDILTDKSQRVIALQTRRGALIEGDEFVLAMGNATASVAHRTGVKLSTYPMRGYIVSVPVSKQFEAPLHNVYTGGMALIAPLGRWLRISGGGDFANPKKPHASQSRFDWLVAQAKSLFPDGYLNTAKMKTQVCYRPVTPDDVPLLGRTKVRNLFVNTGHGPKGWTLSFGAGAMLADEISGVRPKLDISKFDPHRFGMFG